ncbi:MAG: Acyl-CoA:1-acyl-sn-glycerol-3-phosphate acyltransferase [uncultured Nocardioidaceae bacterium]|uniref:Acyl-CoA:1-acyl-sn-glycerol-3-phosphate acyltransferase n=1 Tax=uncultured Nocardioidaceae bacterium TaxID=253824 RepID=A0A6J4M767_9ACTN|nr:MAG: Acyl-CoA:1-acyl-sn-glycerol-3-phosphate acyltransferase [uncultured Nocardioidaceae bacterium]
MANPSNVDLVYPPVIGAGHALFRALGLRLCVEGDHHIPRTGPVVLASNHVSFLDFALVGLMARRSRRYVRFLARHDVWHHPLAAPLMRGMRHIPVDRTVPAAAYLRARAILRSGEAVGVFPESGVSTSYTIRALMPGAVALAAETRAPLVPMAIWGPQRIYTAGRPRDLTRGRPVTLRAGEPIDVPRSVDVRAETARLGERLQVLLDDLQRRPRHQPAPGQPAPWHPAHLGGQAPPPAVARLSESVPRTSVPPSWLAPEQP